MTPKGPSHVDLESAPTRSRRQLFGAIGAAGVASAAVMATARPAAAAPEPAPASPTAADKQLLRPVMEMELTARDLYLEAAAAGMSEEATFLAQEFAANHAAYADGIAGACGFSADTRDDELFREHEREFAGGSDEDFASAASSLENTAVATHQSLFPDYESVQARELSAAILTVEARMATVLVEFAGDATNLDALLEPDAEPLDLEAGAA
jgi:hypothetical protein